jgi:hypothetical protein
MLGNLLKCCPPDSLEPVDELDHPVEQADARGAPNHEWMHREDKAPSDLVIARKLLCPDLEHFLLTGNTIPKGGN